MMSSVVFLPVPVIGERRVKRKSLNFTLKVFLYQIDKAIMATAKEKIIPKKMSYPFSPLRERLSCLFLSYFHSIVLLPLFNTPGFEKL